MQYTKHIVNNLLVKVDANLIIWQPDQSYSKSKPLPFKAAGKNKTLSAQTALWNRNSLPLGFITVMHYHWLPVRLKKKKVPITRLKQGGGQAVSFTTLKLRSQLQLLYVRQASWPSDFTSFLKRHLCLWLLARPRVLILCVCFCLLFFLCIIFNVFCFFFNLGILSFSMSIKMYRNVVTFVMF